MAFEFNQKHAKIAAKCAAENRSLPQNILPQVYIYWYGKRKDATYAKMLHTKTGIIEEFEDTVVPRGYGGMIHTFRPYEQLNLKKYSADWYGKNCITTPRGAIRTYYARYHEKYDCLEIGDAYMTTDRKAEPHNWEIRDTPWRNDRMFLFHSDPVIYTDRGSRAFSEYSDGKFYNTSAAKYLRQMSNSAVANSYYSDEIIKFTKTPSNNEYANGKYYPWSFAEWYKKMNPRNQSAHSKELDSFTLQEIDWNTAGLPYPPKVLTKTEGGYSYTITLDKLVFFEKINDKYSVFRICYGLGDKSGQIPYPRAEKMRLFIDNKGKISIMELNDKKWKLSSINAATLPDTYIPVNFDKMYDVKNLKYIKTILDEQEHAFKSKYRGCTSSNIGNYDYATNSLKLIGVMMRHPILEKLYKAGYKNLFSYLASTGEVAATVKSMFGVNESKKPLYEMLNTNKYIMRWLDDKYDFGRTDFLFLTQIAEIAGCDIRRLTKESFETIANGLYSFRERSYDYLYFAQHENMLGRTSLYLYRRYSTNDAIAPRDITKEQRVKTMQLFRENLRHPGFVSLLADLYNIYHQLNRDRRPNINLFEVDDMYSCSHLHDTLNDILTQQRLEERARYDAESKVRLEKEKEKANKLYPARVKQYEYTDGTYSIVVPKSPADLVTEGSVLSHCVGSYGSRYANGETDILFLRKNSEPEKPYFTVEIRNGYVIQVHGYRNRWVGSDLETARFLYKYFTLNNFKCERKILTNTSSKYGANTDDVPWEKITTNNI